MGVASELQLDAGVVALRVLLLLMNVGTSQARCLHKFRMSTGYKV